MSGLLKILLAGGLSTLAASASASICIPVVFHVSVRVPDRDWRVVVISTPDRDPIKTEPGPPGTERTLQVIFGTGYPRGGPRKGCDWMPTSLQVNGFTPNGDLGSSVVLKVSEDFELIPGQQRQYRLKKRIELTGRPSRPVS